MGQWNVAVDARDTFRLVFAFAATNFCYNFYLCRRPKCRPDNCLLFATMACYCFFNIHCFIVCNILFGFFSFLWLFYCFYLNALSAENSFNSFCCLLACHALHIINCQLGNFILRCLGFCLKMPIKEWHMQEWNILLQEVWICM